MVGFVAAQTIPLPRPHMPIVAQQVAPPVRVIHFDLLMVSVHLLMVTVDLLMVMWLWGEGLHVLLHWQPVPVCVMGILLVWVICMVVDGDDAYRKSNSHTTDNMNKHKHNAYLLYIHDHHIFIHTQCVGTPH